MTSRLPRANAIWRYDRGWRGSAPGYVVEFGQRLADDGLNRVVGELRRHDLLFTLVPPYQAVVVHFAGEAFRVAQELFDPEHRWTAVLKQEDKVGGVSRFDLEFSGVPNADEVAQVLAAAPELAGVLLEPRQSAWAPHIVITGSRIDVRNDEGQRLWTEFFLSQGIAVTMS